MNSFVYLPHEFIGKLKAHWNMKIIFYKNFLRDFAKTLQVLYTWLSLNFINAWRVLNTDKNQSSASYYSMLGL